MRANHEKCGNELRGLRCTDQLVQVAIPILWPSRSKGHMGSTVSTVSHLVHRERRTRALLLQYGDVKGEIQETFKTIKVSRDMRLAWLQRWQSMDKDGSNLLDYQEFVDGCGLESNLWSLRLFDLLDKNFTGSVDFCTFFRSLPRLLVFDRSNALDMAFRMCSRRGATCTPDNAVLDEVDICYVVKQRYPRLDRRRAQRRADDILEHMDQDDSPGISFEEFKLFCDMNPVFLTAVHRTVQAMRKAIFGEQFWKDFTNMATSFDQETKKEIFCSSHDEKHPNAASAGVDATSVGNSVAAAAVQSIEAVAATAAKQRKRKIDEISSLAHSTASKIKRIASESGLAHRVISTTIKTESQDPKKNATNPSEPGMTPKLKHLQAWASMAALGTTNKMGGLTARAGSAAGSLRRIGSDSYLLERARVHREGRQSTQLKIKESFLSARDQVRTLKARDIQEGLRSARKRATERLEERARDLSHVGTAVRGKTTKVLGKTRELLDFDPGTLVGRKEGAGASARIGRWKAATTVVVATQRMRYLTGKKGFEATTTRSGVSSSGLSFSTLARHLPDAGEVRTVGIRAVEEVKQGGGRALIALKRSVRLISTVKHMADGHALHPSQGGVVKAEGSHGRPSRAQNEIDGLGEFDGGRGAMTGGNEQGKETGGVARTSDEQKSADRCRWALTMQFYERLDIATDRLEAKRTPDKGYDFSADFPKLWGMSRLRGSHSEKEVRQKQQWRRSAANKTAKAYMRCIASWQESGSSRSKLSVAFNRWRLHTCDAATEETSSVELREGGTSSSSPSGQPEEHHPTKSVVQMWEAAGGASGSQDLHALILTKERADRPLPSELCEAYTRDMVDRINRRQAENNVAIPMPFY